MILNNIIALVFHMLVIVLSTVGLAILVALSPYIGGLITSLPIRILIAVFWILTYIFLGTRLKISQRAKWDFRSGSLIALIGILLLIYSLINIGLRMEIPEDLSYHAIPLNIFLNPIYQIFFMLGISFNQPVRFISCFIPSLLIGIGLRYKRIKSQGLYQKTT
ncbi:hypothetical protein E9840_02415 [Tissierella creatinini]|nr:hypothetical protein E9840_02415 [Tissierella creatinini]TJX64688.1 hypothetical protein E8P77_11445 [Soehngenia saccharolytica]